MPNLLPPQYKQQLKIQGDMRLVGVLIIIVVASFLIFSLVLAAVGLYVAKAALVQEEALESISGRDQTITAVETAKTYSAAFERVSAFYARRPKVAKSVDAILAVKRPSGIYFTNISLDGRQSDILVAITGVSDTREHLQEFEKNLKGFPEFSDVAFPPETWIAPTDVNFTITFKIAP